MRRGLAVVDHSIYINYSQTVSGVANLYLLRAVQETVDSLRLLQSNFEMFTGIAVKQIAIVSKARTAGARGPIDHEGKVTAALEENENILKNLYQQMQRQRQAAFDDPELTGEHEETIVLEYDRSMERAETLHQVTRDLRWEIMEHDSDLEKPSGKIYQSSKDLISSILN